MNERPFKTCSVGQAPGRVNSLLTQTAIENLREINRRCRSGEPPSGRNRMIVFNTKPFFRKGAMQMTATIPRPLIALLVAMSLIVEAGCAQRLPYSFSSTSPAVTDGLNENRKTIGLAVISTAEPKFLARVSPVLSDEAERGFLAGARAMVSGGFKTAYYTGIPHAYLLAMLWPVGALGGAIYGAASAQSVELLHPLSEIKGAEELMRNALADRRIEEAIRDRVEQVAPRRKCNCVFLSVPYETVGNPSPSIEGTDTVVKVAVEEFGLAGEEGDDPRVALRVRAWTYFKWTTSESAENMEYEGRSRKLSAWAADNARLFRQELNRAVQSLAEQIVDGLVPVGAVVGAANAELERAQAVAYPCGRRNPNCEGLVGDTDHPDYVPLSDSLAPDPNQEAERLSTQVLAHRAHARDADRRDLALGPNDPAWTYDARGRFAKSEPRSQQSPAIDGEALEYASQSHHPVELLAPSAKDKKGVQPGGFQSAVTVPIGPSSERRLFALRKPSDSPAHDRR